MEVCLSYLGGYEKKTQWEYTGELDIPYHDYVKNKITGETQPKPRHYSNHIPTFTAFVSYIFHTASKNFIPEYSFEQNTLTRALPNCSIHGSFAWLVSAFDQHRNIYEDEQDLLAKQEMERVLRQDG